MAVADLEAFIRERLGIYDSSLDATSGSPLDTQVIQPILRRLGSDPFTIDFVQFAQDRLAQEFPDMATKDGDAITDLLIKPALLLLDPVIRENVRLRNAQSFRSPELLTTDEADALGANLFAQRSTGDKSRGQARIYFAAPQSATISPANFVTSKSGLHFFPTSVQSIRSDEMLFNLEGTLYYFDVNVEAESAGDAYNIGPDELVSIANLTSAVRVTNKRRFRFGVPAETAVEFVGRAEQELSEKSLVTRRGALSKITSAFSEVTNVAVVGFNDPNMQRDVLRGGGLGRILGSGFKLLALADGENAVLTRRVTVDLSESIDFVTLAGQPGPVEGFVLTIHGGFTDFPAVRDVRIRAVVDERTVDLEEQVIELNLTDELPWVLRKNELTLSSIPGGILFPDTPTGELLVPDDQIHIGGATDYFVRGTDFDTSALVIDAVVDDNPILSGTGADVTAGGGLVSLGDYVLGTSYASNDSTYLAFNRAVQKGFTLQILDGPAAGSYRIIDVTHAAATPVELRVDPAPTTPPGSYRWRLLDVLDIDLTLPKETKVTGSDLKTIQGIDEVQTVGGLDFQAYGVGQGDILKIESGPDAGEYSVLQVLAPLYQKVQLDRPMKSTGSGLSFSVYRANTEGGVNFPLVRFTSMELLDSSGQATGTTVPYGKPVDIRTRNFANVAHGIKQDLADVQLGLISVKFSTINLDTLTLKLYYTSWDPNVVGTTTITVVFAGAALTPAQVVTQINTAAGFRIAVVTDTDRVGIIPFGKTVICTPSISGDTAGATLFGTDVQYSIADVRSGTIDDLVDRWGSVSPAIDPTYDVVEVLDGYQVGYYDKLTIPYVDKSACVSGVAAFLPEVGIHARLGSRSLGVARLYFLEPTSIEFDDGTLFSATLDDGSILNYLPDPSLSYQIVPALPNDSVPKDGVVDAGADTLTSASGDFFRQGVLVGDTLEVTYQPKTGTVVLDDPVLTLTHKTIILSVGGGVDKTIIFVSDDPNIGAANVTRKGVADQINKIVGQKICSITAGNALEFEADVSVIIRKTGTANVLLGFSTIADENNDADTKGSYTITALTDTVITVSGIGGIGTYSRQHFKVFRSKLQRIVSTTMSTQVESGGLYYCDVELISQGTGDRYNLEADIRMTAEGYSSDGYWLTTEDPNLTFSTTERPVLHISRSILEVGVSDSPVNATQISGQNLQISYERSSLVSSVQNFVSAEEERVLCESPLARHLIPYFVRFDASYVGGSKEDVVIPDIEKFIKELEPQEYLEVSDVERLILNRSATSVENPIDLIAVVHNFDRSVTVERSQNRINTTQLAAFIPDSLNVVRKFS